MGVGELLEEIGDVREVSGTFQRPALVFSSYGSEELELAFV